MKRLTILLSGLLAIAGMTATAQTADDIIAKHIEAVGGADSWKKINTVKMEGNLQVNNYDVTITRTTSHNKGTRQDVAVAGMNGYTVITPTAGWTYEPYRGQSAPEAMTAGDLKARQDEIDAQGNLLDYKQKGHTAELLGQEMVNNAACYKILLSLNNGKKQTIFIDSASYYVDRITTSVKLNGQETERTTDFRDYRKLPEGIVVPMIMVVPVGPEGSAELKVNKMEINKPVEDSFFKAG